MQNNGIKKYLIILIIVLIGIFGVLVFLSVKNLQPQASSPSTSQEGDILSKLSSVMILPDEKNPKIATISDVDKLKTQDQEFYKNAKNGDTIIIYSSIVVIYRSSENKIVNIAPISQDITSTP